MVPQQAVKLEAPVVPDSFAVASLVRIPTPVVAVVVAASWVVAVEAVDQPAQPPVLETKKVVVVAAPAEPAMPT
jgi:hypothetical protein